MFDDLLFKALIVKLREVNPGKYISITKSLTLYSTSANIEEEITLYIQDTGNKTFATLPELMEHLDPIVLPEIIVINDKPRMFRG